MPTILDQVPDSHRDLLEAHLAAVLSTVDAQGRPQSTAIWYFVDADGELKSSTTSDRQKFENLRRNPGCVLFIMDPENSFRTLELRAEAELVADPDKETARTFARVYGVDEGMFIDASQDRYTIIYRLRRVVVNPPSA